MNKPQTPSLTVYVSRAHGVPQGGHDARVALGWKPESPLLVFDHAKILKDYLAWRQRDASQFRCC